MTDLKIRSMIIDEISVAQRYADMARKNKDAISVTYFHGYSDGLRTILDKIDFTIDKELEEMESEENDRTRN